MKKVVAAIALSMFVSPVVLADEEIQLAAAIGSSGTRSETGAINTAVVPPEKDNAGTAAKEAVGSASMDAVVFGVLVGVGLLAAAR